MAGAFAPSRSRKRVPPHLLRAARRIDRTLDIVWCEKRERWVVTRKGNGTDRCIISGEWHYGRHIVIRWETAGGGFIPLCGLLIQKLADMDSAKRVNWEAHLAEIEAEEGRQHELIREQDEERKKRAAKLFDDRVVKARSWSVGGMSPKAVNRAP